jgi:hypothetical protein
MYLLDPFKIISKVIKFKITLVIKSILLHLAYTTSYIYTFDFVEVICVNCPALEIETLEYSSFENQLNRRNKLNFLNID